MRYILLFILFVGFAHADEVKLAPLSADVIEVTIKGVTVPVHLIGVKGPNISEPKCKREEQRYGAARRCIEDRLLVAKVVMFNNATVHNDMVYADIVLDGESLTQHMLKQNLVYPVNTENPWCN